MKITQERELYPGLDTYGLSSKEASKMHKQTNKITKHEKKRKLICKTTKKIKQDKNETKTDKNKETIET